MKKHVIAYLLFLSTTLLTQESQAVPQLRLPFEGGEIWRCDQSR